MPYFTTFINWSVLLRTVVFLYSNCLRQYLIQTMASRNIASISARIFGNVVRPPNTRSPTKYARKFIKGDTIVCIRLNLEHRVHLYCVWYLKPQCVPSLICSMPMLSNPLTTVHACTIFHSTSTRTVPHQNQFHQNMPSFYVGHDSRSRDGFDLGDFVLAALPSAIAKGLLSKTSPSLHDGPMPSNRYLQVDYFDEAPILNKKLFLPLRAMGMYTDESRVQAFLQPVLICCIWMWG